MEKIVRFLQRQRREGYNQTFMFTTYSLVFESDKWPESPVAKALLQCLQAGFLNGLPSGETSPSQLPEVFAKTKLLKNHHFTEMAKGANYRGFGLRQHDVVQKYFLVHDAACIATEMPLWSADKKMTGCADIVRLLVNEHGDYKVQILDFKPGAEREKTASTQVLAYRKMLHEITGIPLKDIECFYFDDQFCYQVFDR